MSYAAVLDAREMGINEALKRRGAGFGVRHTGTFKNNGVRKEGYTLDTGRSISPVFYPPEEWLQEATDDEVADRLIDIDADADDGTKDINLHSILEADYILSNVKPRLYGAGNREDMDSLERAYMEYLDFLIGYYVEIPEMSYEDGVSSISITRSLMEETGLSVEELHIAAIANLTSDYKLQSMIDLMNEFFGLDEMEEAFKISNMMVVTNSKGIYGAACILSEKVQEELTEILGETYIILPSSIHEVLAIPFSLVDNVAELLDMVTSINADVVQQADILTDSVYLYKDGSIQKVA